MRTAHRPAQRQLNREVVAAAHTQRQLSDTHTASRVVLQQLA